MTDQKAAIFFQKSKNLTSEFALISLVTKREEQVKKLKSLVNDMKTQSRRTDLDSITEFFMGIHHCREATYDLIEGIQAWQHAFTHNIRPQLMSIDYMVEMINSMEFVSSTNLRRLFAFQLGHFGNMFVLPFPAPIVSTKPRNKCDEKLAIAIKHFSEPNQIRMIESLKILQNCIPKENFAKIAPLRPWYHNPWKPWVEDAKASDAQAFYLRMMGGDDGTPVVKKTFLRKGKGAKQQASANGGGDNTTVIAVSSSGGAGGDVAAAVNTTTTTTKEIAASSDNNNNNNTTTTTDTALDSANTAPSTSAITDNNDTAGPASTQSTKASGKAKLGEEFDALYAVPFDEMDELDKERYQRDKVKFKQKMIEREKARRAEVGKEYRVDMSQIIQNTFKDAAPEKFGAASDIQPMKAGLTKEIDYNNSFNIDDVMDHIVRQDNANRPKTPKRLSPMKALQEKQAKMASVKNAEEARIKAELAERRAAKGLSQTKRIKTPPKSVEEYVERMKERSFSTNGLKGTWQNIIENTS